MILRRIYNLYLSPDRNFTRALCDIVGFCPKNLSLYHLAFRHSSSATDGNNNERLEMLGDSVLNFVVADFLFNKFPSKREGFLTEMRSKIVSRQSMNDIASDMGLQNFIRYSHSIRNVKENDLLGNCLEALIGAVYLDKDYKAARNFILNKFIKVHIDVIELANTEFNYKSRLLNWAQLNKKTVEFKIVEEKKIKHRSLYKIGAFINDEIKGEGTDFNKKQAEKQAAEAACKAMSV